MRRWKKKVRIVSRNWCQRKEEDEEVDGEEVGSRNWCWGKQEEEEEESKDSK